LYTDTERQQEADARTAAKRRTALVTAVTDLKKAWSVCKALPKRDRMSPLHPRWLDYQKAVDAVANVCQAERRGLILALDLSAVEPRFVKLTVEDTVDLLERSFLRKY
jgi:hypothetical protein